MNTLSRRSMLHGLGALGLGAALPAVGRARQGGTPCKLLMVAATGGWDISYALDPKPDIATVDSPTGQLTTFGDLPVFTDDSRPNITAFFEQWAERTAVVNGIDMRSISHVSCLQKIFTGAPDPTLPDFGVIVGHQLGAPLPIPTLVLGDLAFPGPLGVSMARVGLLNQMSLLANDAASVPTLPEFEHAPLMPTAAHEDRIQQFLQGRAERAQAIRGAEGHNAARVSDFIDAMERSNVVRANAGSLGEFGLVASIEEQIDFAVQALHQDLSWVASISTRVDLDTHAVNELQSYYQEQVFSALSTLAQRLSDTPGSAGGTLLDETLVVVFSEMSRTPRLNAQDGKDHWPVTSALMFGGPVAGGRTYGSTNDLVEARPIDLLTADPSEQGQILEPDNLLAGIIEAVGADPSPYLDVEPFSAPFA